VRVQSKLAFGASRQFNLPANSPLNLTRQQRRRICQVAGKALVKEFGAKHPTETRGQRQQDRKILARNMFKRANAENYEQRIVEPDSRLVVPDTRIVVPDFSMVEK
jgi:hypothetical protein